MSSLRFLRRFRRLFEMASWLAIRSSPMLWRSAARLISPRSSSRLDIRREIPAILGGAAGHQCVPTTTRHLHLSPKNARQSYTSQYRRFANSSRRSDKRSSGPNSSGDSTGQAPTLTQRLKNLSRKYGWVAVAVYLALSVIDFPICFFMVRGMGVEQIGRLERTAVDTTKKVFGSIWPGRPENGGESSEQQEEAPQEKPLKDHEANLTGNQKGLWTQLVLAYAIHKSVFIFARVPLTAVITPKIAPLVKQWGTALSKKIPRK